jgi:hypothetical protein
MHMVGYTTKQQHQRHKTPSWPNNAILQNQRTPPDHHVPASALFCTAPLCLPFSPSRAAAAWKCQRGVQLAGPLGSPLFPLTEACLV